MVPDKLIWVVTYNYGTVKAGPVIRFTRYAALFKEMGYELIFVTKKRDGDEAYMENPESGIKSIHIACKDSADHVKKAIDLAKRADKKPIALFFFSVRINNYLDFISARRHGLKLIYVSTMHLDLTMAYNQKRSRLKQMLLAVCLRAVYNQMDQIVSSTKALQKDFVDLGIAENKLKIIYNGVNIQKFAPVDEQEKLAVRRELQLPESGVIFLYVGLFVYRKGVLDMLNTFSSLYDQGEKFKLVLVGQEAETPMNTAAFNASWPEMKSKALNEGWLVVHPFSDEIHKYYKAADSFVFMSRLEGMPNVLIEAMATGLPVLTSRFDGFSEDYGISGEHFYTLSRDIQVDQNIILEVLKNEAVRKRVGAKARAWTLKNFAVTSSIQEYIDIIHK